MIPSRAAVKIRIRGMKIVTGNYAVLASIICYHHPGWGAWINANVDGSVKFRDVGGL